MAKFIPAEFVEALEYDFTQYGGSAGTIEEPSTGTVNKFFKNMKNMVKEVKSLQKTVQSLGQIEEMDDDALVEQMSKIDEAEAGASDFQQKTTEYLAELCGAERQHNPDWEERGLPKYTIVGGSPSVEDLGKLPYRVLQAFSQWLIKEIQPKKTTPGTMG